MALYLPTSPLGADFRVDVDATRVHAGSTRGELNWVARVVFEVNGGSELRITVDEAAEVGFRFNFTGVTFFSD